jgi:hypothetical protein
MINKKKIMTDLAAGHINEGEAEELMKGEKMQPEEPVSEKKASEKGDHTRKRSIKSREVK